MSTAWDAVRGDVWTTSADTSGTDLRRDLEQAGMTRARVRNTTTGQLGNVVHAVVWSVNGHVARCKVHGGWRLESTTDAVTCGACSRKP